MLSRLKIDTGIVRISSSSSPQQLSGSGPPLGLSAPDSPPLQDVLHPASRMRSISNASSISSGSLITPITSPSSGASCQSLDLPASSSSTQHDPHQGLCTPASPVFDETIRMGTDFVLALHDYDATNESATCLSFKAGQVIRVHNRDASGWWDGELDGRRGWFPSNFVCSQNDSLTNETPPGLRTGKHMSTVSINSVTSWAGSFRSTPDPTQTDDPLLEALEPDGDAYCHPLMVPLLHALSLLQSAIRAERKTHYSPSTACVISCVRSVLSATDTLRRDSPTLLQFEQLAQVRKEMLETLAFLVGQAKAAAAEEGPVAVHRAAVHGMLRYGGQIFECVQRYLTLAVQCGVELPERRASLDLVSIGSSSDASGTQTETGSIASSRSLMHTKSTGHIRSSSEYDTDPARPLLPKQTADRSFKRALYSGRQKLWSHHQSKLSVSSSGSSASSFDSPSPAPAIPTFPVGPASAVQVLEALRTTHDEYLSTIAAFIGYAHSYSRLSHASSTGHMYELVRDVVDRVCKLLSIVEAVIGHPETPTTKIPNLRTAKHNLYSVTSSLADSVRFLPPSTPPSESTTEEDERQTLIHSATSALRAGADCVAAVKACLIRLASDPRGTLFRIELPLEGPGVVHPHQFVNVATPTKQITPTSPRRSASMSELTPRPLGSTPIEEVTIQVQNPTPIKRTRGDSSASEASGSRLSQFSASPSSTETPLTSLELSKSVSPSLSLSLDAVSETSTSWEGSLKSALEQKILHGDLPSAPVEDTPREKQQQQQREQPPLQQPQRSGSPSTSHFSHDYALDEVAYNSEGHLVGATMAVLVEKMTPHDSIVDPAFCAVFFMTFRLFSCPTELLDVVMARYNLEPPSEVPEETIPSWQRQKGVPVRLRVSNFLKLWLETYWRPGVDDVALDPIQQFTSTSLTPLFPKPAQRILELIEVRRQSSELVISPKGERIRDPGMSINPPPSLSLSLSSSSSSAEIPRPSMTKTLLNALRAKNYSYVAVTDFDALELARQLTIMECALYCAIKPEEVLDTGDAKKPSASIKAMSTLSTNVTGWVAESILNEHDAKKRTGLVKFFIKVADRCTSLQNFSTSRSILAALDSSTISRLHQTWVNVPQKNKAQLEALRRLADHGRNYHEYRSRLRNTAPPAVPFLGLYLTDVTFCREGNPTHRASPVNPNKKLLNFNKYHKLARIVQDMQRFQVSYNLKSIPEVQVYLDQAIRKAEHHGDLQDLYRRSLMVEPRRPADVPPPTVDVTRQLFGWVNRSSQPQSAV